MKKVLTVAFLGLILAGCQSTTYYTPYPPTYVAPRPVYVTPAPVYVPMPPVCRTYTQYNPYIGAYQTRRICR